jgi:hypothetical protein
MNTSWGRPRPKFSDLSPPSDDGDDGGVEPIDSLTALMSTTRVAPLVDYPLSGCDGTPCAELQQTYVDGGFTGSLKNFYTSYDNGMKSPEKRFTCIFTCPISWENFASGNMKRDAFNQGKSYARLIDGVCWHNTKKLAMNAAAARALDCFSLRRCHGTDKSPWRRCEECPYLSPEDAPQLPALPPNVALPRPSREVEGHDVASPKLALVECYASFFETLKLVGFRMNDPADEFVPGKNSYRTWGMNTRPEYWTALFTCHLSGERFQCGKLIGGEGTYKEDYMYFDQDHRILVPRGIVEGASINVDDFIRVDLIWYKTKKEAIDAAAGRAVDCFRLRSSYNDSHRRYCSEIPYTIKNSPAVWKSVSEHALRAFGGEEWPLVPYDERFTTQFDVLDIHSLLESEHDWRKRYRKTREMLECECGAQIPEAK